MSAGDQPRSINSPCVPSLARESRQSTSTADCRDSYNGIDRHGPVHSKLSDELREYLANQPRLVLVGVNGVAHLFQHFSFHSSGDTHVRQK